MRTARQITAQAKSLKKKREAIIEKDNIEKDNFSGDIFKDNASGVISDLSASALACMGKDNIFIPNCCIDNATGYLVTDANGHTLEQLNTSIPEFDHECIDAGIKIPLNYGLGIKITYEGNNYIMKRGGRSYGSKPVVTLNINSWLGISIGALHYYGKLNINLPQMTRIDKDGYITSSHYFPMFKNSIIKLTQVLEQWEIDKYPENYMDKRVGDKHKGFYTREGVIRRAKEVMPLIFGEGWELRIED